jgi:arylsulfatase A-like enzyme
MIVSWPARIKQTGVRRQYTHAVDVVPTIYEKAIQIEIGFILKRLAEMADADTSLRDRQPWKAAYEHDYAWLGNVITKHYHGDDSDVKVLMGGILRAFAGMTVEEYAAAAEQFLSIKRDWANVFAGQ